MVKPVRIPAQGLVVLCLLTLLLMAACTRQPSPVHTLSGPTMGTVWNVRLANLPENVPLEQVEAGIVAQLLKVNQQMSTYIGDSDISRFNQSAADSWHRLPAEFATVLTAALALAQASDGAFDPTVGPLVNLWGFGPEARDGHAPDAALIEQARARTGWQRVLSEDDGRRIYQPGGLYLDLSAIAKGYAVDAVGEYLDGLGITGWLVDIGGDLRTRGVKPDGSPWRIAIERPVVDSREINNVLEVTDLAVATSGDYRNFFDEDDAHYSHTLDPRTGRPVDHRLASVSVLHEECMQADGLATLLTVLGPEAGLKFAREQQLAVLFIVREGEQFREIMTDDFRARLTTGRTN